MGKLGLKYTDLNDTLYGGIAGILHHPDTINIEDNFVLADAKLSQDNASDINIPTLPETSPEYEVVPTEEIFAASLDGTVDIRPRVYDAKTDTWVLVDTGSMVSCIKPEASDTINPHLRLETVDGSEIPCYGRKNYSIRLGRKEFHIPAVISKTTDTILGMDFIKKYRFDLRWDEFGDYYTIQSHKSKQSVNLSRFLKEHYLPSPRCQ